MVQVRSYFSMDLENPRDFSAYIDLCNYFSSNDLNYTDNILVYICKI